VLCGLNINRHIIDSAFTICFDDRFKPLLDAAREATNIDVKTAGIDVPLWIWVMPFTKFLRRRR
jgi:methionyl aminopeptidase